MSLMLPSAYRKHDGDEQPGIHVGMFTIRLPFIHFPIEIPEIVQAMVVCVVGLSAIDYMQEIFGMPFAVALTVVCIHEVLEALYSASGEPLISGWITPAIPIITTWIVGSYNAGSVERMQALIALQVLLGIFYLVFGLTGIAKKLVDMVPVSIKAGILLGAGVSAILGQYGFASVESGGVGFFKYPFSFSTGVLVSFFLLYSKGFDKIKQSTSKGVVGLLSASGFLPAIIAGYIVGIIFKEIPLPTFDLSQGLFFNPMDGVRAGLIDYTILSVGVPPIKIILNALPIAFITYIISFGNIVAGTEIVAQASQIRTDEHIDINPNRANVLCGLRNIIQGMFAPTVVMSGPLWAGMQVTITERYKLGKESMYTIFGGLVTFGIAKAVFSFVLPIIALVTPILPLGMSLTLMIQAFALFTISLDMCTSNAQRGVAGITGGILAVANPAIGLIIGVIVWFFVEFLLIPKEERVNAEDK